MFAAFRRHEPLELGMLPEHGRVNVRGPRTTKLPRRSPSRPTPVNRQKIAKTILRNVDVLAKVGVRVF
jgi:hypothetical protein